MEIGGTGLRNLMEESRIANKHGRTPLPGFAAGIDAGWNYV
jgi:hypothetical protein